MKKFIIALLLSCSFIQPAIVAAAPQPKTFYVEACGHFKYCHPALYYIGKGLYIAGKYILPKRYAVSVYTKEGKTVNFVRYGFSAWGIKRRLWRNAHVGNGLQVWRTKDDEGLTLRIPLDKIQNIAVVRAPKKSPTPVTNEESLAYFEALELNSSPSNADAQETHHSQAD